MKQILAINGGVKTIEKNFEWPLFDETEVNAVTEVVRAVIGEILTVEILLRHSRRSLLTSAA